jgi:hypothetical protein
MGVGDAARKVALANSDRRLPSQARFWRNAAADQSPISCLHDLTRFYRAGGAIGCGRNDADATIMLSAT